MKLIITLLLSALTLMAKSQTQEICPGPIPAGWVIVGVRTCAGCCGATGLVNLPTIKKL
jgi:hypothetical protein